MRKWAVGIHGWVEVRSASTQPHKHTSYLPVTTHEDVPVEDGLDAWGYHVYRTVRKPITKKYPCVTYSGGTVLEVLTKAQFRRKYGVGCPAGTCIELQDPRPITDDDTPF
jgi:hypothetical protein